MRHGRLPDEVFDSHGRRNSSSIPLCAAYALLNEPTDIEATVLFLVSTTISQQEIRMNKWVASLVITSFGAILTPAFAGDMSAPPVSDATPADGSVELSGGAIAAGIGYTWGDGTLTFNNSKHNFGINGVSIVDVGASKYSASGTVYHLKKLSDFDGNYVSVSAGVAIAGGADAVYLRNQNGVVIKLASTEVGLRFNLAASGVDVALKN